jgi:hypothetical protein
MMHAYTKPEAEAQPEQTATDVLADDLHSAIAFENLRETVKAQQLEIGMLSRTMLFMLSEQRMLRENVVELTTRCSELTGAVTKDGAQ